MNKDFYTVICPEEEYNLLFHQPSSTIARIDNRLKEDDLNVDELNKKVRNFPIIESNQDLKYGKGKITLTFMSARTCNLGCKYCFAEEGEYGLNERKPKYFTYDLYVKALYRTLEMYPEGIKRIGFFGGEPLLNFKEIKHFIPKAVKIFKEKDIQIPLFTITSNLTLLTYEMADFFKRYGVLINVSLDGEGEINDRARRFKAGFASVYETVVNKCYILESRGIPYSIEATLNKNHVIHYQPGDAIKWIKGMEKSNYQSISIIPVETQVDSLSIKTEEEITKLDLFTRELVNYYLDKVISGNMEKLAPFMILPMVQITKKTYLRSCTSGQSFFCDTDENLYPCHMFCNDPDYKLGNLEEGIHPEKSEEIANVSKEKSEFCSKCIARNICAVWCKGLQYLYNDNLWIVCKARCVYQRAIFEECLKRLSKIDQRNKFFDNYRLYRNNLSVSIYKNESMV